MRRRDVLLGLGAGALALPVTALFPACDPATDDTGDDTSDTQDTSDTSVTCTLGDASGNSNSHGHSISIPQADLESPSGDRTYTSTGGTHTHEVTLTAAERQSLVDNCQVTVQTTTPHAHTWTITLS